MKKSNMIPRCRGWTLIELLIVIVVLAILFSIAYPSYLDQVRKARRADGQEVLLHAAQRQQQYYSKNNTFADTVTKLNLTSASAGGHYTLSVSATTTTYALTATPTGDQAKDTKCGNLGLNHLGTKSNSGTLSADKCW